MAGGRWPAGNVSCRDGIERLWQVREGRGVANGQVRGEDLSWDLHRKLGRQCFFSSWTLSCTLWPHAAGMRLRGGDRRQPLWLMFLEL